MSFQKSNFFDLNLKQIESVLIEAGHKKFRAHQLYQWVYNKNVVNPDEMLNLSKDFRNQIPDLFDFELPKLIQRQLSTDGTRKYLFEVGQGLTIESVMIPSGERRTLCVSSEVGCNMACHFCYTGRYKLKSRLSAGQIVGQFIQVQKDMGIEKLTNIVFMGMGEPLDNPDAVFQAIEMIHEPLGINLSRKKITVSTSGLVPLIPQVTQAGVRLAVSLNASNDEIRSQIMPINKKWQIKELLRACLDHAVATRDKVTLEYVLLKGITDDLSHARELYRLTQNIPCKINIIPFNEHPESDFLRPDERTIDQFQNELIRLGAHVLRRKTMGRDILAACGQLAKVGEKKRPESSLEL